MYYYAKIVKIFKIPKQYVNFFLRNHKNISIKRNMLKKLIFIPFILLVLSCKAPEVITVEKTIVQDSLIYLTDTITVQIPYEVVKETIPDVDTSIINTTYATSVAYLDTVKKSIYHSLEQKGELKAKIDTLLVVEYLDREIEKEVIKEVPYIPIIFYITFVFSVVVIALFVIKLTH